MELKACYIVTIFLVANLAHSSTFHGVQRVQDKDSPICLTPGCIHSASNVLKYIDQTVDPCDDFYQFACGGFIKETNIPDDKAFIISFNIIGDRLNEQIKLLIEEPPKPEEPKPFRLIKKYYKLCMDEAAIEADNLSTMKNVIKELGGWPVVDGDSWNEADFDWKDLMYKLRTRGFPTNSFFRMYAGVDTKNTSRRLMNFDQADLGLDREYILQGLEDKVVKAYYDYLVDVAVAFGADTGRALKETKESLEFETELARISLSREDRLNMTALYNPMPVSELQKRVPSIPWITYINKIIAIPGYEVNPEEIVDVGVPKFMSDLDGLLNKTPKRVLANYLIAQAVKDEISKLNKKLRDRELEYNKIGIGTQAMHSRWSECVVESISGMKLAASALYVRKYFNEDAKKRAVELVSDLKKSFKHILETIDWMDETTKSKALEKLINMQSHIAYPEELLDDKKLEGYYSNLDLNADDYLTFNLNIRKFKTDKDFKKLRELVNKTDWVEHGYVTNVNAYYNPIENSIQLPAGILQGMFFDNDRPSYMNYGAMGYAIGHEITHGFDDGGRQYDKDGVLYDWWEKQTDKAFIQKAQCIIDQYGNYTAPEVNLNVNGIITQGENIADNGGVKEAYIAYKSWVEQNGEEPKLPGLDFSPRQLFWISMANLWCTKQRNEYLKQQIMTNSHSPPYFRVIGSFSNSEDFAKDFNCPLGSKMNPEHKCQVW